MSKDFYSTNQIRINGFPWYLIGWFLSMKESCVTLILNSEYKKLPYDSPNNIVSAFRSKKEREIHSSNKRNGFIILAIITMIISSVHFRLHVYAACLLPLSTKLTKSLFLLFRGWICGFWGSTFNQQFPFLPTTKQKRSKQYQNQSNISQSSK